MDLGLHSNVSKHLNRDEVMAAGIQLWRAAASDHGKTERKQPIIEDLAFLWDDAGHIAQDDLAKLAWRIGPLFALEYERFDDWLAEAAMAKDMVQIQEVLNGARPLALLDGSAAAVNVEAASASEDAVAPVDTAVLKNTVAQTAPLEPLVAKSTVRNRRTNNDFAIYAYSQPFSARASDAFYAGMPALPHFKRFILPQGFDYAFFDKDEEDGVSFLTVTLLSFKRDITALDFAVALEACTTSDESAARSLMRQAEREASLSAAELEEGRADVLADADSFEVRDAALGQADAPHVQRLVHAVVSLRLEGIGVDVFRAAESDDFLVFPMYANYLWYCFAKQLGQVKIGYCKTCGRGFSLTGHRGLPREFCSAACKTKAKNARMKRQRDEARRLFVEEGYTVGRIAREVYAEELSPQAGKAKRKTIDEAVAAVRANLAGYPRIKQMVDAGLKAGTGDKADFVKRCAKEGVFPREYLQERIDRLAKR